MRTAGPSPGCQRPARSAATGRAVAASASASAAASRALTTSSCDLALRRAGRREEREVCSGRSCGRFKDVGAVVLGEQNTNGLLLMVTRVPRGEAPAADPRPDPAYSFDHAGDLPHSEPATEYWPAELVAAPAAEGDLAETRTRCTPGTGDHPRFSSGVNTAAMTSSPRLWDRALRVRRRCRAERTRAQLRSLRSAGPERSTGPRPRIRQFVVGTGGAPQDGFGAVLPTVGHETRTRHGVLKLSSVAVESSGSGRSWPSEGDFRDSGMRLPLALLGADHRRQSTYPLRGSRPRTSSPGTRRCPRCRPRGRCRTA